MKVHILVDILLYLSRCKDRYGVSRQCAVRDTVIHKYKSFIGIPCTL